MATLALPHPVRSTAPPIEMESWLTEPQGAANKQLRDHAQDAVAHWMDRAEYLLGVQRSDETYVSVPFTPVKKVRVTYRHVGELKPAPYPLDE